MEKSNEIQQLAIMYEQIKELEESLDELESVDTYDLLRVPQYIDCDTDPKDPHKKAKIEFPREGNVSFIINFVKGNNLKPKDKATMELQFYDEDDPESKELKTFAYDPIPHLPKKLYPGAHALFQTWVDDDLNPNEVSDDDYEARSVECIAMTSFGIPPEIEILSKKIDDLLRRVEALEKKASE